MLDLTKSEPACLPSCFRLIWLCDPMAAARQSLLSVGFSRQEHWSGLPCPPPGDLPSPGTEPTSLMSPAPAGEFFTIRATWNARMIFLTNRNKVPPSHTQVLEGSTAHQTRPHRPPAILSLCRGCSHASSPVNRQASQLSSQWSSLWFESSLTWKNVNRILLHIFHCDLL